MNFMIKQAPDVGYSSYHSNITTPLASYLPGHSVTHSPSSKGSFCPHVEADFINANQMVLNSLIYHPLG